MEDIVKPENTPPDLVLMITYSQATGDLTVRAPGNGKMYDEPMSFWMLDKAKKFIERANSKAMQPTIVPARPRIKDIFKR
jgi:hypothetical protein